MCQAKFLSELDPTWYEVTVDNAQRLALPAHNCTNGQNALPQALLANSCRLVKHFGGPGIEQETLSDLTIITPAVTDADCRQGER